LLPESCNVLGNFGDFSVGILLLEDESLLIHEKEIGRYASLGRRRRDRGSYFGGGF